MDMEKRRNRIRHISAHRTKRELRLTPGFQSHEALWAVTKKVPTEFEPYTASANAPMMRSVAIAHAIVGGSMCWRANEVWIGACVQIRRAPEGAY